MSKIVGYLFRGTRYTPLGMKEWLIRDGRIPREAFEPRRDLGMGLGYALPRPGIDTVIDAYAPTDPQVFMDQPETYSSDYWPKFVFDDEVPEWSLAYFIGRPDVVAEFSGATMRIAARIVAKVYHVAAFNENPWCYTVDAYPLYDVDGRPINIDYGNVESADQAWSCVEFILANRDQFDHEEYVHIRADKRGMP